MTGFEPDEWDDGEPIWHADGDPDAGDRAHDARVDREMGLL